MYVRLVSGEAAELGFQRVGQRRRERRQQHLCSGVPAGQKDRPVQRDDGLAGSGRAGDPRRAAVVALSIGALRRVQEDGPLLPRVFKRPLQFLDIREHAEPAQRIGVAEWIGLGRRHCWGLRSHPGREIQERLRGFLRQVIGHIEERVLGRRAHRIEPFGGHAETQQVFIRDAIEEERFR